MDPRNLVVTYHYVRPENSEGAVGVTPREFREHLRLIKSRYRPVTAEMFVARHRHEGGMALVTFDDALRDQYEFASPILDDEGVPAVFFAPMRPYSGEPERWCAQHLVHALAHTLGWTELERRAGPLVAPLVAGRAIDRAAMDRLYHYDQPHKRYLKYVLAFVLEHGQVTELLRRLNSTVGLEPEEWYMTARQLLTLQNAGHALGGHGFDHVPFSTLSAQEQAAEMRRSQEIMRRLFGDMARPMAYPFGRSTEETERIARACGYTHCFGTEERVDAKFLREVLGTRAVAA